MNDTLSLFAAIGAAAMFATVLCRLIIFVKMMDHPNEVRKSAVGHDIPTPSSGGAGFITAAILALAFFSSTLMPAGLELIALGGGVLASVMLGLADDLKPMNAKMKLLAQVAIALGMVWYGVSAQTIEPGFDKVRDFGLIGGAAFSLLWIVTLTNAVNFMDGANGLSMGMAMFASMAFTAIFGLLGMMDLALISAALTGALAGFLIWNMPGKLFAGDSGALAVGTALGGLSLLLVKARPDLVFVPAILVSPFLVDVILTLILRLRRGDKFWEAHADHVYQVVLKAAPLEHWQLSIGHWMIAANCAALGVAAALIGQEAPAAIFIGVILLGVWMHIRIRRAAIAVAEMNEAETGSDAEASSAS